METRCENQLSGEFLRVAEVAARLHLSERTVRDRIAERMIPSVQLGGRGAVLIPATFLAELEREAARRAGAD